MPTPNGPGNPDKIRAAITASGLSNRDIARRMDVSDSSISHYRHGFRKPAAGRLSALARALRVDVRTLL